MQVDNFDWGLKVLKRSLFIFITWLGHLKVFINSTVAGIARYDFLLVFLSFFYELRAYFASYRANA